MLTQSLIYNHPWHDPSGYCEVATHAAPPEWVKFIGNAPRPQNNLYLNTHKLGWRNHPNFSWNNQGPQKFGQQNHKLDEIVASTIINLLK